MFNVLRAEPKTTFEYGPFRIRRMRPGQILPERGDDAFGPLSVIDHANLEQGTLVKMHEHNNDEILSYMWRGSMVHEDSAGNRVPLSPKKLMMMNAGESFWHEESTPLVSAEMLQIFIRPRKANLEGRVQFMERRDGPKQNAWTLIGAPEGIDSLLEIRQAIYIYDTRLDADTTIEIPTHPGFAQWLYVMDGEMIIGGHTLAKGDAISDEASALTPATATKETTLVCFLVYLDAESVLEGTISGKFGNVK
ncbi:MULTISPECIES: pirin family protein [Rahnella]|uniref:Pirin family protein n=1 Tax=Rahnella laticis TaxID=2787622 RepID=A0ABS0E192_9GAMM|nr:MULTISPECIES: pirin family protein [Rahnella]MBF7978868.1 pirin family protein [Rahnella laticis]MBF7998958.1 pirin family protein [Rahnella sp. LAC-M12]